MNPVLHRIRALVLVAVLLGSSWGLAQTLQAMAYLPWWTPESWRDAPLQELDRLLFFEFKVDASGAIVDRHGWPQSWTDLQSEAARQRVPIDLVVTLFDAPSFNTLFKSTEAMQRLQQELLDLAASKHVAGIHLDFEIYEATNAQAIETFRKFVQTLAKKLHTPMPAKSLSVFLPAGEGSSLYNAAVLNVADFVVLQAYDTHFRGSKTAGPVAPLAGQDVWTWYKAAETGLALGIPPQRLLFGFPLYGYEWTVKDSAPRSAVTQPGQVTTFAPVSEKWLPDIQINVIQRVSQYGAVHDAATGSAYYKFKDGAGVWHEGWFEDWWSLEQKSNFVAQQHLGGIAFFLLGYDQNKLLRYYLQRRGIKSLDTLIEQIN